MLKSNICSYTASYSDLSSCQYFGAQTPQWYRRSEAHTYSQWCVRKQTIGRSHMRSPSVRPCVGCRHDQQELRPACPCSGTCLCLTWQHMLTNTIDNSRFVITKYTYLLLRNIFLRRYIHSIIHKDIYANHTRN